MTIRCTNCSHLILPEADGRTRPWCSTCGAGLADAGERRQTQPASAPPGTEPAARPLLGVDVIPCAQPRRLARKPESPWLSLVIGLGVVGLGVAVVVSKLDDFVNGWSSRTWPKTQGTVVRSWVEEWQSTRGGRSFTLAASYRYEVAGRPYENNNIHFSKQLQAGDRSRGEQELAKIAPAGKFCVVYYDPSNPARSCLVPGLSVFYLIFFPLFALFLLLIGGIGTWISARQILAGEKSAVPGRDNDPSQPAEFPLLPHSL